MIVEEKHFFLTADAQMLEITETSLYVGRKDGNFGNKIWCSECILL